MDPIRPPPGAPDQLGVVRAPAPEPAASAIAWSVPAPEIRPADPAAWSTAVPLEFPLVVDGVRLDRIAIHRPTGADIAELMEDDGNEATLPVRLRARICGVHPAVFGAMWPDDSERVAEACRPFLPSAILDIEAALEAASASG
ncbi:phage tail assembly protein [Bosea sp. TAB14]|uniref:phage tail assembly protein n=1 Tax=Bosea sp. TAB14 TaxID=3237481 RepID=UPI003F8F7824